MEQFPFMIECLKRFNYPKIHSMDELEAMDIFSKTNRHFLIAWIFKQMEEGYHPIIESSSKEDLAHLIYLNGFCMLSEKEAFMNGELDSTKQLQILYKILKFLECVTDKAKIEESKNSSFKEIDECLQFDSNLFPMYGSKQTLTPKERAKKIEKYKEEIAQIKQLMSEENKDEGCEIDPSLKQRLNVACHNLEINFPDFSKKVFEMLKNRHVDNGNVTFAEDFPQLLGLCADNVKAVLQFIKNMNTVMNLENFQFDSVPPNNRRNAMMRELANVCNEIAALKKENLA